MGTSINLFSVIFVGFLLVYLVVTFWIGRKGTTLSQFYINEGNTGPWLVAGTYTATWISAVGMIGNTGIAYKNGIPLGVLQWGAFVGYLLSALVIGGRLRRFGQVTLGDFFGERFNSKGLRYFSALVTIIGLGAYFCSNIIGSAVVTERLLGVPYDAMVIVMVVVFVLIAATAGAKSVTITDTIMLALVVFALGYIFSPMIISYVGIDAYAQAAKARPEHYTAGGGVAPWGAIIGFQVLWAFGNAANPSAITRSYLAKDGRTWVQAMIIAYIASMSVVWLTHLAAQGVYIINPGLENQGAALTWAAMNGIVTPLIGAVAIAGIFGACLSTASTQVLSLSFSVSRDLYERGLASAPQEKTILRLSRVCIVLFGVMGILLSMGQPKAVVTFGAFGSSTFAASFFPPLFLGLYWRDFTKEGAWASMAGGIVLNAVLHAIPLLLGLPWGNSSWLPLAIHPTIWSVAGSFLIGWAVSKSTKPDEQQLAVFSRVSSKENDHFVTPKSRMVKYIIALVIFAVIQTGALLWFAVEIG